MAQQKYKLAYLERGQDRISFNGHYTRGVPNPPLVDNFAVLPLEERAHLGLAGENGGDEFPCDLLLCLVRVRHVPFL